MVQNGIGITETDYLFAIHSNNPAVIRFVEEKLQSQNENNNEIYIKCFKKSVKYFNSKVANYFLDNYLNDVNIDYEQLTKYYNFDFIETELIEKSIVQRSFKYYYYLYNYILFQSIYN